MALLEEAVDRAAAVLAEARPELDAATREAIAEDVGIGAVKYADLSVSHDSEYTFDFDRMLALHGNTGPYLQYATARIRSMFRKAGLSPDEARDAVHLGEEAERSLALALLGFGSVVQQVGRSYEPHRLCAYLFDLAQTFTTFYEQCPVLRAPEETVRASRLTLSAATLAVLVQGLDLLGMTAPEQM
jgi:arginyl-tRNA synthetase